MRRKFDRLGRAAGDVSGSGVHAKHYRVVTRAGRQAFETYLAKMRLVTGQPSKS
jgi:hypothetical protein